MSLRLRMLSIGLGLAALFPTPAFAVPANDNFDSPTVISGFPLTATGSNLDATVQSGEALPAGYEDSAVKSVWFSWTAPTSGIVQIDTFGSHQDSEYWDPEFPWFNPIPSVWLGDTLETLVEVQSGGSWQIRYLHAVSGTTYRIAVFGLRGNYDEGQIVLNLANAAPAGISGHVVDTNGVPLSGIKVNAFSTNDYIFSYLMSSGSAWAFTDAAGNYAIRGLSNDSHLIRFGGLGFATEYYDDVPVRYDPYATDLDAITRLTLTNGETISNIDAELTAAASVSGTVTGPGGLPLAGVEVRIHFGEDWYNQEATTDENGDYLVENLPPDAYGIRFSDPSGDYLDARTNVVLTADAHLADVDGSLGVASKIAGTVVADADGAPLDEIDAIAYRWTGEEWDYVTDGESDANGHFLIGGLAAGTYRVRFWDGNFNYLEEVYDDVASLDAGTDVALAAATVVSNINASLAPGASISGTVTTTNGDPVAFYRVDACQWNGSGWDVIWSGWTENGLYVIKGLPAGTYRIWFAYDAETFLPEAYDDAANLDSGTDVTVAAGGSVSNINAVLAPRPPVPPTLILCQPASTNSAEIRCSGTVGSYYVAQQAPSLSNGWTDVGDSVYCENGTNAFIVPLSPSQTFLRIRLAQ